MLSDGYSITRGGLSIDSLSLWRLGFRLIELTVVGACVKRNDTFYRKIVIGGFFYHRRMKKHFTHIEALRGLAILLVLLYHLVPKACPNGYFGVDVFLLISGYLLVLSILKDEGKPFSIREFVNKKVLRIFPPLLVMVLTMMVAGLFFFPYAELLDAAKTAKSAICGYSNVYLDQLNQGYFAAASEKNPFLHTWYLSVTIQIYCIFAFVVFLLKRFSIRVKWLAILGLGACSLGIVLYYRLLLPQLQTQYEGLKSLYYWTWNRMFEVVAGAVVLLLPLFRWKKISSVIQLLAFLVIVYCCFVPQKHFEIVFVSALLLLWVTAQGVAGKLWDNRIFRFLGKYSFSIYLWHWPIIVYRNYTCEHITTWDNILLFLVCLIVGVIAYYLVEIRKWRLWAIISCWVAAMGLCVVVIWTDGLKNQLHSNLAKSFEIEALYVSDEFCEDYPALRSWNSSAMAPKKEKMVVSLGDANQTPSFIMLGDSHASAFVPGMAQIAKQLNLRGYYFPTYVTPFYGRMCARIGFRFDGNHMSALLEWLEKHQEISHVVLVQRWVIRLCSKNDGQSMPLMYDGSLASRDNIFIDNEIALEEFCRKLTQVGKKVVIMTEVPNVGVAAVPYLRRILYLGSAIDKSLLTCTKEQYYQKNADILRALNKIQNKGLCSILPIHESLIKNEGFYAFDRNIAWMSDGNHISSIGAIEYAKEHYMDWKPILCTGEAMRNHTDSSQN